MGNRLKGLFKYLHMPFEGTLAVDVNRSPDFRRNPLERNTLAEQLALVVLEVMHTALWRKNRGLTGNFLR